MELDFLQELAVPTVVGICLCVGYALKHLVPTESLNRFIPISVGTLGIALNIWICQALTPEVLLGGLFSGLASTGLHQAFKQCIDHKEDKA